MRSPRARSRRLPNRDGTQWLSFSDLMSSLLLIFILIMFYIMYQYFDMYEINMAEIARQQYDLDQATASLESERTKLSAAESQVLAQQIKLNAAQKDLDDAESILASQQQELAAAQSLLDEKETEIAAQQETLDALSVQLGNQQTQINQQQATLTAQEKTLTTQAATLAAQKATLENQQATLDYQQATLEDQQKQIEQLVGMRPRIISSISAALREANISAQVDPTSGAIALESDVMFATGEYELSDRGKAFIGRFLPVYLEALFDEEYLPYVAEIIIEGHTDSQGTYLSNLELSQRRALAVATYVLSDDFKNITSAQKARLREMATANGRSFSDLVRNPDGTENMDASRRVVFKFRLTDEQMIQQLKDILEAEEARTGE